MKQRWAQSSRYEKALSRWYPFGVPAKPQDSPSASRCAILFIAEAPDEVGSAKESFSGAQGELLRKAVTQGLRWNIERADLIYVSADPKNTRALSGPKRQEAHARLESEIKARKPHTVVALGSLVSQVLNLDGNGGQAKGWQEKDGKLFFATLDLHRVLSDSVVKKSFWLDLKEIAARIDRDVQ